MNNFPFWLELSTDLLSFMAVVFSFYYVIKLIKLGEGVKVLAIQGGKGPKYIAVSIFFLAVNRFMDLIVEPFLPDELNDIVLSLDDPPAALAAIFLVLGLRNMYTFYVKASKEVDITKDIVLE